MNIIKYLIKPFISKNSTFISYVFYLILFQSIFSQTLPEQKGKYLKTFELKDGNNILLCTEKGIYLYNKSTNSLTDKKSFDAISLKEFNLVTIEQFEEGRKCIIVLYKNKIYIFTEDVNLFIEESVSLNNNGYYFALVPYIVTYNQDNDSNDYYFIVGYLKSNEVLMANLFVFNNVSGQLTKGEDISLSITNYTSIYSFAGFSCQLMNSESYGQVLTCFFNIQGKLVIESYSLTNFQPISSLSYKLDGIKPYLIHSVASKDKTQSLICYLKNQNTPRCDKYNINSNSLSMIFEDTQKQHRHEEPSTSILYTSVSENEFIYACRGYNDASDFSLYKINSNFEFENSVNTYQKINNNCEAKAITLLESWSNENKINLITSCEGKSVTINDLPDSFQLNKDNSPQSHSPSNPVPLSTTSLPTTSTPTTYKNEHVDTTNLSKETTYLTTFEEETTNANKSPNEIDSTQFVIPSTDINIDTTENLHKIVTENLYKIVTQNFDSTPISELINTTESSKNETIPEEYLKYNETYITTESSKNETCPEEYLYQNVETKECLKSCSTEDLRNKKCKLNFISNSNINNFTENIRNLIKEENITSDTNIVLEGSNTIYQIISSNKMQENENTNISIIDLGECEKILLDEYNLSYLLILKIDSKVNENTAVILNYEVYNPYTNEKLNLSLCNNVKINTYSSYYPSEESISKIKQLNELGYDLYNINDDFYQDICSSFTSENGTDILLSDRKSDFYENTSLCENDCTYKGYDLDKKRVQCECSVKEEIKVEESSNNNILENFFSASTFSNIKLLKCYKLVFSAKGQKNNKGSIIFLCINFSIIVSSIIYAIKHEKYIMRNFSKINNEQYKESKNKNFINNRTTNHPLFPPKKAKKRNKRQNKSKKNGNVLIFNYINSNQNMTNSLSTIKPVSKNINKNKKNDILVSGKDYNNNCKITENVQYDTYNFINEELNSLSYDLAFKYDKRTFCQYYYSLLKQKHLIVFTFCNYQDYNIFILKLSLFLSSFALYFTVNALFFTDETMHNIYKEKGKSNIFSQISNIFYSTIISCFINMIIKKLGLSYSDMVRIKQISDEKNRLKQSIYLRKKLKIKFSIFFIFIFILVSFFWYFISAFCAVYKNTQKILIENTLSSFALSLLYPFGINLIPGIFRIPSLKNYSGFSKCMYFFSKLVALV